MAVEGSEEDTVTMPPDAMTDWATHSTEQGSGVTALVSMETAAATLSGVVVVDGVDEDGVTVARHMGQAPEVDGCVLLDRECGPGSFVQVEIVDSLGYDLVGEVR